MSGDEMCTLTKSMFKEVVTKHGGELQRIHDPHFHFGGICALRKRGPWHETWGSLWQRTKVRIQRKEAMLGIIIGGSPEHYSARDVNRPIDDLLFHLTHGTLFYASFHVLPTFVIYKSHHLDE
jgi:putative NADPH-quinone reductase